ACCVDLAIPRADREGRDRISGDQSRELFHRICFSSLRAAPAGDPLSSPPLHAAHPPSRPHPDRTEAQPRRSRGSFHRKQIPNRRTRAGGGFVLSVVFAGGVRALAFPAPGGAARAVSL